MAHARGGVNKNARGPAGERPQENARLLQAHPGFRAHDLRQQLAHGPDVAHFFPAVGVE